MDPTTAHAIAQWLAAHGHWALAAVFAVACAESLAVVGLLVPGALILFGVGALVGGGVLNFWWTALWAIAGAITGDALSYALGRRYRMRLRTLWPFRAYPRLTNRGVDFFHRHGGKSVVLGRFVGPLRPIIPAVAGMMGMPPLSFALINVLSALLWGPAYLLPGMAFGASLGLASEVAGRLAVLLVAVLALLWLTAWLLARIRDVLAPRTGLMVYRVTQWSQIHPVLGRLPASLIDPEHPELRVLGVLALSLVAAVAGFTALIQAATGSALLENLDKLVLFSLSGLRTPWGDRLMVLVTGMGDALVLGALVAVLGLWLLQRRFHAALWHWLAAAVLALIMTHAVKIITAVPRPGTAGGTLQSMAFPSAHAATAMAVYGFLAAMLVRELPERRHALVYGAAGALVTAVGFSRLYLGVHWLSDVLGGLTLGLAWAALLAIAYRRHPAPSVPARPLLRVTALALTAALAVNLLGRYPANLSAYRVEREARQMHTARWWREGWAELPAWRDDLLARHRQALTVQWAGPLARVRDSLAAAGWQAPPREPLDLLQWLRPSPPPGAVPVLPQVHDGHHEALLLTRPAGGEGERIALRVWPTGVGLHQEDGSSAALWTGNITRLRLTRMLGLSVLRTAAMLDTSQVPLGLETDPGLWRWKQVRREDPETPPLLLVRPSPGGDGALRKADP